MKIEVKEICGSWCVVYADSGNILYAFEKKEQAERKMARLIATRQV